ncbi:hypothetical protein ANO11243_067590 [Dothideomycetidae sp. 11243]|nr:hypothetical protein ANO11243_067590 [fungal sp. No.11243]
MRIYAWLQDSEHQPYDQTDLSNDWHSTSQLSPNSPSPDDLQQPEISAYRRLTAMDDSDIAPSINTLATPTATKSRESDNRTTAHESLSDPLQVITEWIMHIDMSENKFQLQPHVMDPVSPNPNARPHTLLSWSCGRVRANAERANFEIHKLGPSNRQDIKDKGSIQTVTRRVPLYLQRTARNKGEGTIWCTEIS